jgi:DNA relaxase NicK
MEVTMTILDTNTESERVATDAVCAHAAISPVLVTRDETNKNPIHKTDDYYDGERFIIVSGNKGQATPVFIPNSDDTKPANIGHIDWLAFTIKPAKDRDWRWLRQTLEDIFNIPEKAWQGTNKKWSGYQHRVDLINPLDRGESINLGLVGYGGKSQRGTMHVSLNAHACAQIKDWLLVHDWAETVETTITRVDVAHDDFEGETINIDIVKKWYQDGLFNFNGRPPSAQLIDDLGSGKGKTFYVGNRTNGKLVRFYEKGKKEGDPESNWVRVEVEWHNKNRLIPWDIVINPGQYLAGAYPCLEYLSLTQHKIKTLYRAGQITYDSMVRWLRTAAGKSLNAMLKVENGDMEAVLEQIVREGIPKRLEPYAGMHESIKRDANEDSKS